MTFVPLACALIALGFLAGEAFAFALDFFCAAFFAPTSLSVPLFFVSAGLTVLVLAGFAFLALAGFLAFVWTTFFKLYLRSDDIRRLGDSLD